MVWLAVMAYPASYSLIITYKNSFMCAYFGGDCPKKVSTESGYHESAEEILTACSSSPSVWSTSSGRTRRCSPSRRHGGRPKSGLAPQRRSSSRADLPSRRLRLFVRMQAPSAPHACRARVRPRHAPLRAQQRAEGRGNLASSVPIRNFSAMMRHYCRRT